MMTMILLTALAMASSLSPARAELVDLELVLAVDISGSVDEEEAELQRAVRTFRPQNGLWPFI